MASKHILKAHLIFCVKYRNKLLQGKLNEHMKAILVEISENSDFNNEVIETDKDHVHMMIDDIPRLSISSIVNRLKAVSTNRIWKLYPNHLKKHFWQERTFWSDGYFVCSIGEASPDTIRRYIETQG